MKERRQGIVRREEKHMYSDNVESLHLPQHDKLQSTSETVIVTFL